MNMNLIAANGLDPDLAAKLYEIIKPEKYHEFTDLLVEILLRRQKEFDLSDVRILTEARNLVENLPVIKIVHQEELPGSSCVAISGRDGIKISYEYYASVIDGDKDKAADLYETLVHEVYHSIARREDGTAFFNSQCDTRGMNELLNEAAANRAVFNFTTTDLGDGIRRTSAYTNLTIFSPSLAAAFGVSEKELLTAGISKDAHFFLASFLLKNVGHGRSDYSQICKKINDFLMTISKQFEIIHNLDNDKDEEGYIPEEERPKFTEAALSSLVSNLFEMISFRLENDSRPITASTTEEYAHSYLTLCGFIQFTLKEYVDRGLITQEQADEVWKKAHKSILSVQDRIVGLKSVVDLENNPSVTFSPELKQILYESAKNTTLMRCPKVAAYFGIAIPENKHEEINKIDISKRAMFIYSQDWDTTKKKKNTLPVKILAHIFKEKSKDMQLIENKFLPSSLFRWVISNLKKPKLIRRPGIRSDIKPLIYNMEDIHRNLIMIDESLYSDIINNYSKKMFDTLDLIGNQAIHENSSYEAFDLTGKKVEYNNMSFDEIKNIVNSYSKRKDNNETSYDSSNTGPLPDLDV